MNQNSKTIIRQFAFFILFALIASALCVSFSCLFAKDRNSIICSTVESLLIHSSTEPLTRISDCARVKVSPGVQYIVFANQKNDIFYAAWLTVNGLSGPELPLFLIPKNATHFTDLVLCGNLAVSLDSNSFVDSGLTSVAIAGCKKRLFTLFSNGDVYDAK